MTFTEHSLSVQLAGIAQDSRLVVAFSGGLDSSVLLYALHRLHQITPFASSLCAIHVNHGLSPNAAAWQHFCEQTCARLGIELLVECVHIDRSAAASLENLAREQRYAAFARRLEPRDCLLMAHHLDDQAETFLLRTLRGAGPRGLAAIPASRPLGTGMVLRPLLGFTRRALEDFARAQALQWIEDESNASALFDRNYCRLELLPLLEQRWPAYRESWRRSAQLCGEAEELLQELAAQDYALVVTDSETVIDVALLKQLSQTRQRNLLRYWLLRVGVSDPGWHTLQQIVTELLQAATDAQPHVSWFSHSTANADAQAVGGAVRLSLRRHRDHLHLLLELPEWSKLESYDWAPPALLPLTGNGSLRAELGLGGGLRQAKESALQVRYRQGGESCRLAGRRTRSLKKILQDAAVAPWLRHRLPLLYSDDELVCIPGIGVCEGWQAREGEPAWEVFWVPPTLTPKS